MKNKSSYGVDRTEYKTDRSYILLFSNAMIVLVIVYLVVCLVLGIINI